MAFNWLDYLHLAEKLCCDDQACNRSSVSRAYYALYHILKGKINFTKNGIESHQGLIEALQNPTPDLITALDEIEKETVIEIGNDLAKLRAERNQADYEMFEKNYKTPTPLDFTKIKTKKQIDRAKAILEAIGYDF